MVGGIRSVSAGFWPGSAVLIIEDGVKLHFTLYSRNNNLCIS